MSESSGMGIVGYQVARFIAVVVIASSSCRERSTGKN